MKGSSARHLTSPRGSALPAGRVAVDIDLGRPAGRVAVDTDLGRPAGCVAVDTDLGHPVGCVAVDIDLGHQAEVTLVTLLHSVLWKQVTKSWPL